MLEVTRALSPGRLRAVGKRIQFNSKVYKESEEDVYKRQAHNNTAGFHWVVRETRRLVFNVVIVRF